MNPLLDGQTAELTKATEQFGLRVVHDGADVLRLSGRSPTPSDLARRLTFALGRRVEIVQSDRAHPIEDANSAPTPAVHRQTGGYGAETPVVPYVDGVLRQAIGAGASDVHVEPGETGLRVRFRVDGALRIIDTQPAHKRDSVVSRIKVMSGLDIAEKRRPQDGRLRFADGGTAVDMRVATLPTAYGEKVVLRILDRRALKADLASIGFGEVQLETIRCELRRPHGMILVTGPTGSGKTTTLYAALKELNTSERNVLTVEDPIEYHIEGIAQAQAKPDIGFTFASALRAFLRQDPDVIMVGEIRDAETAAIAVRAALTGHLVLSTLHTNDAPSTIGRLLDMGIEPYLLAGALRLVIAQRLVRRVCAECAADTGIPKAIRTELNLAVNVCRKGIGCEACGHTGYHGRIPLFEMMPVGDGIVSHITERATVSAIREHAHGDGMRSLADHARDLITRGLTTPEEALQSVF
jgi:type II secretory ATPase GspE/PulE/Tfp pilus assembly ATPase PilB-like protein